jgi:hypothetical protein
MRTSSPVVAFAFGAGLVVSLAACSSDGEDAPPSTDVPVSVIEAVPDPSLPADTAATEPVPSGGIGSIDGPASVDPDFSGANPAGGEGGG